LYLRIIIHPLLTEELLNEYVKQTRELIINLVIQCEKNIEYSKKIIEKMIEEILWKTILSKQRKIKKTLEKIQVNEDLLIKMEDI
jgi:tRNA U34 5-carboxymethylaminomethyl modifying GTPase MnmE/TrmE